MPSFVIGDNEMITDPKLISDGTVAAAMAQVLGGDSGWGVVPSTSVHVADVARLHVEALDPRIPGNQNFLAVSEGERGTRWEEAVDIVNRNVPGAVKKGVLPNNATSAAPIQQHLEPALEPTTSMLPTVLLHLQVSCRPVLFFCAVCYVTLATSPHTSHLVWVMIAFLCS